MPTNNSPIRTQVGECSTSTRVVELGARKRWRVVLQETLDRVLLIVWHLEVVAETAAGKDHLFASTLRVCDFRAGVDLGSANASDVGACT